MKSLAIKSGLFAMLVTLLAPIAKSQVPLMFSEGSWQEAKLVNLVQGEKRRLNKDFVAQLDGDKLKVSLESRGLLNTSPDQVLLVSLVQTDGERQDKRPDANGLIEFDNVREGIAAIVVTADSIANTSLASLYAAMPLMVTPGEPGIVNSPATVPVAQVNPADLSADLNSNADGADESTPTLTSDDFELVERRRFQVQRMADGSVRGQVVVPQQGYLAIPGVTKVTFHRIGTPPVTTYSNEEGYFVCENVEVGFNSVIATGRSGHAAFSIEVVEFLGAEQVDPLTLNAGSDGKFVTTSNKNLQADSLTILLVPPALLDDVLDIVNERMAVPPPPPAAPMAGAPGFPMGGGYGGGYGGGGGAAGGGSGIGAAIGLAGLAAGLAAIDNDDDGFNLNQGTVIAP